MPPLLTQVSPFFSPIPLLFSFSFSFLLLLFSFFPFFLFSFFPFLLFSFPPLSSAGEFVPYLHPPFLLRTLQRVELQTNNETNRNNYYNHYQHHYHNEGEGEGRLEEGGSGEWDVNEYKTKILPFSSFYSSKMLEGKSHPPFPFSPSPSHNPHLLSPPPLPSQKTLCHLLILWCVSINHSTLTMSNWHGMRNIVIIINLQMEGGRVKGKKSGGGKGGRGEGEGRKEIVMKKLTLDLNNIIFFLILPPPQIPPRSPPFLSLPISLPPPPSSPPLPWNCLRNPPSKCLIFTESFCTEKSIRP